MKNFVLIVHASLQQDIADLLRGKVSGFTFSHVEGHGKHSDQDPVLSSRDKVVGYVPRVRVDILIDDAEVELLIQHIKQVPGISGHGIYWVNDVLEHGRMLIYLGEDDESINSYCNEFFTGASELGNG